MPWTLSYQGLGKPPSLACPVASVPTSAVCLSRDSAISNSLWPLHFLPVRTLMPRLVPGVPALLCFSFMRDLKLFRYMLLNGSCSMLLLPYRAALLRLHGRPSQSMSTKVAAGLPLQGCNCCYGTLCTSRVKRFRAGHCAGKSRP